MSYRKIYAEEIEQRVGSTQYCPSRANLVDGFYKMESDPNTREKVLTIDASGSINGTLSGIPQHEDVSGCYAIQPQQGELGCDPNNYMGIDYKIGSTRFNICHNEPVQTYFSAMFDDPNTLTRFFKLLIAAIIILLVTTIFGCCYEFWLRYGDSIECFYYYSKKCKNISKDFEGRASLIDYMFPNDIHMYPYQKPMKNSPNQMGGTKKKYIMKGGENKEGFNSKTIDYKIANGEKAKCITLHEDYSESDYRPFPYSVADFVHSNDSYHIIKTPLKFFSFTFLYCVLLTRAVLNYILRKLSSGYQNNIKSATASNIVFLLLCGLLLPYSPIAIIGMILAIITALINIFTVLAFIFSIHPLIGKKIFPHLNYSKNSEIYEPEFLEDYYKVFNYKKYFYSTKDNLKLTVGFSLIPIIILISFAIAQYEEGTTNVYRIIGYGFLITLLVNLIFSLIGLKNNEDGSIKSNIAFVFETISAIFKNILLMFNLIIIFGFSLLGVTIGSMFANAYMILSTFFNFLYIPITQPLEFFDIMKDHADLLTILFCIGVIGSASFAFDRNTTGVMSGILVVLILYKISKGLKAK